MTNINEGAFLSCSGLTSVTIPNSVTEIGVNAFSWCSGLISVTINSNAVISANRSIGRNLRYVFGNNVKNYVIGDDVTSIGRNAFYECSGLLSVTIPESVTSIGDQAFYGSGLLSVIIPNNVTTIGENAFRGNTNLNTVMVGKNISNIGDNAFSGCSNMTIFTSYAADIPAANSSVFEGIDLTNATLYVPASALEEYEETKPGSRFGAILPIDENSVATAIDSITEDNANKVYYDLRGRRMTSLQSGLLIVKDKSGIARKVIVK